MTVECEEFEYCKVKVHYVAEPDLVKEKRDEIIFNIKKAKPKTPGFRPGKVTDKAIRIRFKKQISNMLKRDLVSEAYDETLFETKMKPIFYPEVHESRLDGNNFECDMTFLKKPDFKLKEYKGFKIPKPHVEASPTTMAEQVIERLRWQHADPIPYGENDDVQFGDQVTIDIVAKDVRNPDNSITSLTTEGSLYTVGSNPVSEIDQKMVGMKAGEEREFDIIFEDKEEYAEEVRGKRIKFNVKVHMGTKKTPLPLDDTLAEKVGFKTFDELRNQAEGTSSARIDELVHQQVIDQVMKRILEAHDFEIPTWHVLMESQKFVSDQGLFWDDLSDEQIDNLNNKSKDKIKLTLILDAIRDNEPEVVLSDYEVQNKIREQLISQGQDADKILSSLAKDGSLIGTIAALKNKMTIQWLVDQSEIIE